MLISEQKVLNCSIELIRCIPVWDVADIFKDDKLASRNQRRKFSPIFDRDYAIVLSPDDKNANVSFRKLQWQVANLVRIRARAILEYACTDNLGTLTREEHGYPTTH